MKILLSRALHRFTEEQVEQLKKLGNEIDIIDDESDLANMDITKYECVVSFKMFEHRKLEDFTNLKVIQSLMAGKDGIDIEQANKRGIKLYIGSDIYSIPISEFVLFKTLQITKDASFYALNKSNREWNKTTRKFELYGKSVAIVGYGSIGRETAKRFKAFGMKVDAFNRTQKQSEYVDEFYPLEEFASNVSNYDVVVSTIGLSKETEGFFSKEILSNMKDNRIFINVSRGGVVDEQAMINLLKQDKFMGVGLDVTAVEPLPIDSELWSFDNVYITPHSSFVSDGLLERAFERVYENIKSSL